jgi:hypothetical protein
MPFLEILTRTFNARPHLLRINQDSLQRQTVPDWMQTLLIDDVGRGIDWASENLAAYAPNLVGEYVWILDDDDTCILSTLVAELKAIAAANDPDVIMLRMDHGAGRCLPGDDTWLEPPVLGQIGCSAFVVRRAVWQAHAVAMAHGHYASDYDLIAAIWKSQPTVYWHDVVASRVMRQSFGRGEVINPWHMQKTTTT